MQAKTELNCCQGDSAPPLCSKTIEGDRPPLQQRTAATRAAASAAAKAVISYYYFAAFERGGMDIPQEEWLAGVPLHTKLLVEIAIIDFAAPAHAEGVAAHEARNRRGIKCLDQ